jgi:Transposase IS66 family
MEGRAGTIPTSRRHSTLSTSAAVVQETVCLQQRWGRPLSRPRPPAPPAGGAGSGNFQLTIPVVRLQGSRCDVPTTAGTCRDILKRRAALWTFVQVAGVEPTNNAIEQSIRPWVLWRKGSFGTHSEAGSRFVVSMLTVVSTLKQPQRNVLAYLTTACEAALHGAAAPSLLSANAQKTPAVA